jgi:hypothetical protein
MDVPREIAALWWSPNHPIAGNEKGDHGGGTVIAQKKSPLWPERRLFYMTRSHDKLQPAIADSITAVMNTKRQYGLWRGQIVHPAQSDIDEILKSGDPITDSKGFGVRYTLVRAEGRIPHFSVRDAEFRAVVDTSYPAFHHAAVRVLAKFLRTNGYVGLRRLVRKNDLPPSRFEVGEVYTEKTYTVGGVTYRPDIVVVSRDARYPRIEMEVVNSHGPSKERLAAAEQDGALVLWMHIRDLVDEAIFNPSRELTVPGDSVLLERLLRMWFTPPSTRDPKACGFLSRWEDLDQVTYLAKLTDRMSRHEDRIRAAIADAKEEVQLLSRYVELGRVGDAVKAYLYASVFDKHYIRERPNTLAKTWTVRATLLHAGFTLSSDGVWTFEVPEEVQRVLDSYVRASVIPDTVAPALHTLRRRVASCNAHLEACTEAGFELHEHYARVAALWRASRAVVVNTRTGSQVVERKHVSLPPRLGASSARKAGGGESQTRVWLNEQAVVLTEERRAADERAAEVRRAHEARMAEERRLRDESIARYVSEAEAKLSRREERDILRATATAYAEVALSKLKAAKGDDGDFDRRLKPVAKELLAGLLAIHPDPAKLHPTCPVIGMLLYLCRRCKAR